MGAEALARGPEASPLHSPDALFAAARRAGRTAELDTLCRRAALAGAGPAPAGVPVFVNIEPATLSSEQMAVELGAAMAARPVVLEITERSLYRQPAELLRVVRLARDHGWWIALDDVGVGPEGVALLAIVAPEVVKLDMSLIRGRPDREFGRTMTAVMAYAERNDAMVLAEGIETAIDTERALSLGAPWGQGWHFGRPGPAVALHGRPYRPISLNSPRARQVAASPYDAVVADGRATRVATKSVLLQISHHLEEQALWDQGAPMLLAAFQEAERFTPATLDRYRALSARCTFVAALGHGLPEVPVEGVRGAHIAAGDLLRGEWSVVVVGLHYAGALLAHDLGDGAPTAADASATWSPTTAGSWNWRPTPSCAGWPPWPEGVSGCVATEVGPGTRCPGVLRCRGAGRRRAGAGPGTARNAYGPGRGACV